MSPVIEMLPEFDPAALQAADDPIAMLSAARDRSFAARSPRGLELFSYEACAAVLQHDDFGPAVGRIMQTMGLQSGTMAGRGRSLLLSEGDDHAALRRVVSKWFSPRRVASLESRVTDWSAALLAPLITAGEGEFMSTVARRIPGRVFCWMMGVPETEGDRLYDLSERLIKTFAGDPDDAPDIAAASTEMAAFVKELLVAKASAPGDDVATILLEAADAGAISMADARAVSFELLTASTDNTANAAGLMVNLLASHPEQWERLGSDPSLVPTAVEECARLDPVVRVGSTAATADTTLLDVEVPAGTFAWSHLVAAHTDPAVYPDPRRFDIGRTHERPQLIFGTGRHFCLGAALARMELRSLLAVIIEQCGEIALQGAEIDRGLSTKVVALPIEVTARRTRP